ncbi:MAG: aminoacyl-tRNA hydrolase [Spirochaetes bacterium]|nr:aminoacyl-tRNA hydrolase [Spirochaetota bacterium]
MGNPGAMYQYTRHNAGFWVIDHLSHTLQVRMKKPTLKAYQIGKGLVGNQTLYLAKPLTYMNRSGEVVQPLLKYTNLPLSSLLVICDTLDLPPGRIRLRKKGSSAGHNGLKSIIAAIGTGEFMRLYIGIGRPTDGMSVVDYVLGRPRSEEAPLLEEAVIRSGQAVLGIMEKGPEAVMNEINRKG